MFLSLLASESAPVSSTGISFRPETDTWNRPEVTVLLSPRERFLWTDKNSHSGLTNAPPVLMKQSENLSESVVKQMTAQSVRLPPRGGGVGFDWI